MTRVELENLLRSAWWDGRDGAHSTKTRQDDQFDLDEFLDNNENELNNL